ncbi:hypothetical protein SDRG_17076 [Saprolegnia diclina VS20]|uniref:Acyltransferase 3 domain-containing protein n=1 Tax=Saprolegnia diclina (strain VS20) TaxID=1156394 RepID=T0QZ60_SAPDV|nr:hypothetical protein SDRG_17076 [Saprolegnia diclina VS20]EQC25038.1 hypothetical protein SDRG_17076 [Saprolegnia diclina VS20]|eukprot:XP_008621533.1 hypothetical protein SDRG_17076 [Saprolegnia diclina VS20]
MPPRPDPDIYATVVRSDGTSMSGQEPESPGDRLNMNDAPNATLIEDKGQSARGKFYRPDIDGLRTVAIVPVLLFHAYPETFTSGFVGVDVFFVISGFLISGILFKEMTRGSFSYKSFYSRRIRRIFPTLLAVLSATWWLGALYLLAAPLKRLAATMLAGSLFSANLQVLSLDMGYFDDSVQTNPLLHLWSLGVEEQFYIFWPFVAKVVASLDVRRALSLQVGLAALSFGLNLAFLGFRGSNKYAFYMPLCRFWQMAVGGLVAYVSAPPTTSMDPLVTRASDMLRTHARSLTVAAMLLLTVAFLALDEASAFPGAWALLPTIAAALLIGVGPTTSLHTHVLSASPMILVGKLSYALYLWHWPLLVFAKARYPNADTRPLYMAPGAMLLVSLVLAWVSYTSIEAPLRSHRSKKVVVGLGLAMLAMTLLAACTYAMPARVSMTQIELDAMLEEENAAVTTSRGDTTSSGAGVNASAEWTQVKATTVTPVNVSSTTAPAVVATATTAGKPSVPVNAPVVTTTVVAASTAATKSQKKTLNSSRGPRLSPPTYLKIMAAKDDWHPNVGYTPMPASYPLAPTSLDAMVLNDGHLENTLVVIGDSHADMCKPRFAQLLAERGPSQFPTILYKSWNGTPVLSCNPDVYTPNLRIVQTLKPKALLHVAHWYQYLQWKGDPNAPAHATPPCCAADKLDTCKTIQNHADVRAIIATFQQDLTEITRLGVKVFVATMSPAGDAFDFNHMLKGNSVGAVGPVSRRAFRASQQPLLGMIEDAVVAANATLIDFSDNQCDGDVCEVLDPYGNPIMKDLHHFRPAYARKYLGVLDQVVDAAMR